MAWGPISVGGSVSGYTLPTATASVLGGVKTGSNITNSGGTISITKANVTAALGYTPPTANTWRGVQDDLTSTATDQSLSANQGKVLKGLVDGKAASSHTHDDRYYTESEMNTKLNGKANASHTHDDRYYTESEMNTKLNGKANSSHTHNYAGSGSAGGTANSVNGLTFAAQTTDPGAGSGSSRNIASIFPALSMTSRQAGQRSLLSLWPLLTSIMTSRSMSLKKRRK